jgi:hypothetical protein
MRRLPTVYAMALAVLCLTASGPLSGQNPAEDPRSVAATWALEADAVVTLGLLGGCADVGLAKPPGP